MKIGQLKFKAYAVKKPVAVTPDGKFLTVKDVAAAPSLAMGSLFTLDEDTQLKLALKRYAMEPSFRLGVIGLGILTKADVIHHLKKQTEFGKVALRAEMGYCNELTAMMARAIPGWPPIPVPPVKEKPDWQMVKRCILLKLKHNALFCENTTDGVTSPIAAYRIANVHPVFAARGFSVTALTAANDVRANFVPEATKPLNVYIGGVGHGNYPLYTGHNSDHILEVAHYDPSEVRGRALHFLSCRTAAQLGPDTVAKGAKAYAGYNENFTFVWDNAATPVNEFLLFMQADSTYDIWMANGKTAQQAFAATIQAFNAAAASVPNTAAATWLLYDRDHFRLHGDPATAIVPFRYVKFCFPLKLEVERVLAVAGQPVD